MKKVLLLALFVSAAGAIQSQAQLQKGSMLIAGDLAGFDLGLNEGSTFTMNLTPKAAWFVRDNVALGVYVDFGIATAKEAGTNVSYGVGGLGRYYFPKADVDVARSTRFFTEVNIGIQGVNTPGGNSTNGLGLGFGPGLAYFVTNNIALESLLKYNGIVGFGSNATSSRLSLNLGFQIYLPGSKVRSEVEKLR
jgi:opacity protein-like surface antigen